MLADPQGAKTHACTMDTMMFFGVFATCFKKNDKGRYALQTACDVKATEKGKAMEAIMKNSWGISPRGKNNVFNEDKKELAEHVPTLAEEMYQKYKAQESSGKEYAVLWSEGDNYEDDVNGSGKCSPFSILIKEICHVFAENGESHKLFVIMLKHPGFDEVDGVEQVAAVESFTASPAFYDVWMEELFKIGGADWLLKNVFFGLNEQYNKFCFDMSDDTVFVGTEKREEYMYKKDKEGNTIKTSGYNDLCEQRDLGRNPRSVY